MTESRACLRSWTIVSRHAVDKLARMQQPNAKKVVDEVFSDKRLSGMREDPSVDFVFVRDAGRASPCLVSNNSKCGSDKLGRS